MLVYSITSRSSFDEAQAMYNWITRIRDREMPVVRYSAICRAATLTQKMCEWNPLISQFYDNTWIIETS